MCTPWFSDCGKKFLAVFIWILGNLFAGENIIQKGSSNVEILLTPEGDPIHIQDGLFSWPPLSAFLWNGWGILNMFLKTTLVIYAMAICADI